MRCHPSEGELSRHVAFARRQPALFHAWMGAAVYTLWAWGLMWWTPSYLVRSHHMPPAARCRS